MSASPTNRRRAATTTTRAAESAAPHWECSPIPTKMVLTLPPWATKLTRHLPKRITDLDGQMGLAIRLARLNGLEHATGGPFGAALFTLDGYLISIGMNLVVRETCSSLHAENVAITLGQQALGTHDLSAPGLPPIVLVSSAALCVQCFGNVWWSGLRKIVTAATASDVVHRTGFQEGPCPRNFASLLARERGMEVVQRFMRDESCAILTAYREAGHVIYNPCSASAQNAG